MRYRRPELRDRLAAEYALGTLQGRARRHFERLCRQDPALAAAAAEWETRLAPLGETLAPVEPPARIWATIARRTGGAAGPWRRLALLATAAALALAMVTGMLLRQPAAPEPLLLVTDAESRPIWVVRAVNGERLRIRTLRPTGMPPERMCVLWLQAPDGRILPAGILRDDPGEAELPLPPAARRILPRTQVLVSIEPRQAAPADRPRGEVIFRGGWMEL